MRFCSRSLINADSFFRASALVMSQIVDDPFRVADFFAAAFPWWPPFSRLPASAKRASSSAPLALPFGRRFSSSRYLSHRRSYCQCCRVTGVRAEQIARFLPGTSDGR
jgi:hypothetical protein